MNTLIEKFKSRLIKDQLSPNTVKIYCFSAYTFLNIYKRINAQNVISFQHYLEEHYSARSANLRIIAFNKFLTFAGKEEYKLKITKCRQANYLDNVLTYDQYLLFKESLSKKTDKKWYFIVWLLAATGVRISELVQFKVEDIQRGHLDVHAKGMKLRRVFIPNKVRKDLLSWLKEENIESGYIFRNYRGTPISIRGISKGLEHEAKITGINSHLVHPHAFRHLFARKFLEKNGDIATLADLLGHESLDTTKIYLRKTSDEQQRMIDRIVKW